MAPVDTATRSPFEASSLLFLVWITIALSNGEHLNGIRTLVTQTGIDEINHAVVMSAISENLGKSSLTFSGDFLSLPYEIRGTIDYVKDVDTSITVDEHQIVSWNLFIPKIGFSIESTNWLFRNMRLLSGMIHIEELDISLDVDITTTNAETNLSLERCVVKMNTIDLHPYLWKRGAGFRRRFDIKLKTIKKNTIEKIFCEQAGKHLSHMFHDWKLSSTVTDVTIFNIPFSFDYLPITINIGSDYNDSYKKTSNPLGAHSEFTADRGGSYDQESVLIFVITEEVLEQFLNSSVLNISLDWPQYINNDDPNIDMKLNCISSKTVCFGDLIPAAASRYLDSGVSVRIEVTDSDISISPSAFIGSINGRVYFEAENNSQAVSLFSGELILDVLLQLGIRGNDVTVRASDIRGSLVINQSSIGKIINAGVESIATNIKTKLLQVFQTRLNSMTTKIPILLPLNLAIANSTFTLLDGRVDIGLEVCYGKTCENSDSLEWFPHVADTGFNNFRVEDVAQRSEPAFNIDAV